MRGTSSRPTSGGRCGWCSTPCRSCGGQGGGRVILISSIGGIVGIPFQAFYSASKFALEGYGEALAYEVAPFGIQVTLVEPGNVRTEFTAGRRDVPPRQVTTPIRTRWPGRWAKMAEDEANGVSPDRVAAVVQRALEARRPPRRASVGKSRRADRHHGQAPAPLPALRAGGQG